MIVRSPHVQLLSAALALGPAVGCGGAPMAPSSTTPSTSSVAPSRLSSEVVSRALVARFEQPHCGADYCLDPFPLWEVTGIAVSADRIALAGPGALLSVFADGAWTTYDAPAVEGDEEPERVALHVADFTPNGSRLIVGGSEGRLYELGPDGLVLLRTMDGDDGPPTFSALVVVADDDWFLLDAYGEVLRVHAGEVFRHGIETNVDRLISVGRPLEERMVVSGPFGGLVIEDAFGETPTDTPFYTDDQIARIGDYSGCGTMDYDARANAVYERAAELMDEGMGERDATARAERETPPRSEDLPPTGVTIPRSGGSAPALESYLAFTPEGRAILPVVATAPTSGSAAAVARRGPSIAIAVNQWRAGPMIWARLGARGFAATSAPLGAMGVLDVAGDRLLAVGRSGAIASLAPGEDALRYQAANGLLAVPTALRIVDNEHALAATEAGRLLRIDLRTLEVRELASPGGVLRAIDLGTSEAYAVGDDGLAIRVRDGSVTRLASGVSVDLGALRVLGERRLVVAGDASAIAVLAEGEPLVLPRVSSERIVELFIGDERPEGGLEIFARTHDGAILHVAGERVEARPGFGRHYASSGSRALRFAPTIEGAPFVVRDTPLSVAVDTPEAIAPFGALLWSPSHDPFPTAHATPPPFLFDGMLSDAVFAWSGGSCCDSEGWTSEGEQIIGAVRDGCDDEYTDCSPLTTLDLRHRLLSIANGTMISIVRGAGDCPDATLLVDRMSRGAARTVSTEVLDCAAGLPAQQGALQERLAALGVDATWEPGPGVMDVPAAWGEPSGVGFFLRAAGAGVEVVRSDAGNRHATVVLRLARTAMPRGVEVVPLRWLTSSVGDRAQGEFTAFEGDGFFWAGPTPSAVGGAAETPDDVACTRFVVRDSDGETTVRVGPSSRSEAASTLANGTEVHVARRDGSWLSIDTPLRGWLYARNVRCIE